MSKPFIKVLNKSVFLLLLISFFSIAADPDAQEDLNIEGDSFTNLPAVINGITQIKFSGNVLIEQGSLKIKSSDAIVFKNKDGVNKIVLTGNQVTMQKLIDKDFGMIDVTADSIDFRVQDDLMYMKGNVIIKSKVQGEMQGEQMSMNIKTKEIKGVKSSNQRVRLIIKPKK